MRCTSCDTELLEGKRFCHACGTPVMKGCPNCGREITAEFRFCPNCGTRLTPEERSPSDAPPAQAEDRLSRHIPQALARKLRGTQGTGAGERKLVTVLFCDLVGSTAIAEKLDPEEYHELLEEYLELSLSEIYRMEGIVNQLAGDGFMALFGAPIAHEDAPQRAVRAALAIRDRLAGMSDSFRRRRDIELKARIGIHTGPVVVGTVGNDLKMDYTAIGDTTNLASRLQSLAAPGAILVSESTDRLVRGFFQTRTAGPFDVKGKSEPVAAYEVIGLGESASSIAVAAARGLTPIVGREEESAQLDAAFARLAGNRAQVVAVIGEAGSGKSRLLYEFKQRLAAQPVIFFEGRCSSLSQALPYAPIVGMIRQHFDLKPDDPPEASSDRIALGLQALGEEMEAIHPYLCHFLGLPSEEIPEMPADELKRATYEAVSRLVVGASRRAPVIFMVEDLHWIDDSSQEMLELAVGKMNAARVMLLVSHRPDFQPSWRVRTAFTQLDLGRLTEAEATEMIRAIAGGVPPAALEKRILVRAEGNPFFVEELTRGLFEEGYLVRGEGTVRLTRPVEEIRIPDTVQELLAARLDRLGAGAKRVVQVASVLGRQFQAGQLEALLDGEGIDVRAELGELEQAGVIHRKTSLSRDEYRFGESLTQDVAYEGLLLRERRRLHERAGFLLEGEGDSGPEASALIAHHFARSDNRRKAIETLLEAARETEALPSYGTAVVLFRQAWGLCEPILEDPEFADEPFRRGVLEAAIGLCRLTFLFGAANDPGLGERVAVAGRALAMELADHAALATLYSLQGMNTMANGPADFDRGLALSEEGLAVAQRAGLTLPALSISRGLAFSYLLDGRFDLSRRTIEWVIADLERDGHREQLTDLYVAVVWMYGTILYLSDDLAGGLERALASRELAIKAPNRTVQGGSATLIASVLFDRAEYAEAKKWADIGYEIAEKIGNVGPVRTGAALALTSRLELGEEVDPAPYLEQIEAGLRHTGNAPSNTRLLVEPFMGTGELDRAERVAVLGRARAGGRLRQSASDIALADVLTAMGPDRWDEAGRLYEHAIGLAQAIGSRTALATSRVGAGKLAFRRGNVEEARRQLEAGIAICREVGLVREARRAEVLIGAAPGGRLQKEA